MKVIEGFSAERIMPALPKLNIYETVVLSVVRMGEKRKRATQRKMLEDQCGGLDSSKDGCVGITLRGSHSLPLGMARWLHGDAFTGRRRTVVLDVRWWMTT